MLQLIGELEAREELDSHCELLGEERGVREVSDGTSRRRRRLDRERQGAVRENRAIHDQNREGKAPTAMSGHGGAPGHIAIEARGAGMANCGYGAAVASA